MNNQEALEILQSRDLKPDDVPMQAVSERKFRTAINIAIEALKHQEQMDKMQKPLTSECPNGLGDLVNSEQIKGLAETEVGKKFTQAYAFLLYHYIVQVMDREETSWKSHRAYMNQWLHNIEKTIIDSINEDAQPTEPTEKLYTVDEVARMFCEFMGGDEVCNYNNLDKCCDDWCEEHCKKHTPLDCWKHAIESGWL